MLRDKPRKFFYYFDRKKIVIGVSLSILALYLLNWLYHATYVWQSTTLIEHSFFAPNRKICSLSGKLESPLSPNANPGVFQPPKLSAPYSGLKIGILMLYNDDSSDGAWNKELMDKVMKNREDYCKLHKCSLILANNVIDKSRPTAWSKLLAAKKYLPDYDYLFYLDMDIVIMNMDIPLAYFIQAADAIAAERKLTTLPHRVATTSTSASTSTATSTTSSSSTSSTADVGGSGIDFIMASDWSGPNTGAWFIKRSSWSRWFLDEAWTVGASMVSPKTSSGISFPFQYEQRVFHYMLGTHKWLSRGLPEYHKIDEVKSHFVVLPQCALNSYSIHPFEYRANREVSQYVDGDFLIHFPGKTPAAKHGLMEHYLHEVSEEEKGGK